ncbi:antifreeze protein [Mycena latifolia]|nr:antifreeze protein [Mycena latifolia]
MISTVFTVSFLAALSTVGALGPAAVNLRTAANYIILAESGISTSNLVASAITGDIAVSPIGAVGISGFIPILDSTGQFATASQVDGKIFAASYAAPTPSILTVAIGDMGTAFTDANSRPSPNFTNLAAGAIGGLVLAPGLYKWTSAVTAASNFTILGGATDTWIFQVTGTLNVATNAKMLLAGGAVATNIVWVVTGAVTAAAHSQLQGVILGKTSITLQTGATAHGRLLVQTAIALQQATVTLN